MKRIKQLSILLIICLCMFLGIQPMRAITTSDLKKITTSSWVNEIKYNNLKTGVYHQYVGVQMSSDSADIVQHSNFCLNEGHNYIGEVIYEPIKVLHNESYACALLYLKSQGKDDILEKLSNSQGLNGKALPNDYQGINLGLSYDQYVYLQQTIWDTDKYLNSDGSCKYAANKCSAIGTINGSTLKIASKDVGFNDFGQYYISDEIKIEHQLSTDYSISLQNQPKGTIVTKSKDSIENIVTTNSKSLYIKIPKSAITTSYNDIKLTISSPDVTTGSCEHYNAYVYEYAHKNTKCGADGICGPEDTANGVNYYALTGLSNQGSYSGFQHLALLYYNESTNNTTGSGPSDVLKLSLEVGSIEIIKTDSKSNKPIQGVKFKLYEEDGKTEAKYANGTAIGELTTDTNGKITINNLLFGDYVLKEVASAEGYLTNEKVYPIQIKDISVIQIKVTNNPVLTKISKKDITNEKELVGAHIVITDESDNIRAEYDSTEEPYEFYLGPGKYKLKETVAPEGYDLVETVFEFEILKNGNVKLLSTESDYFKTDKNEIILYNKVTEVPVPDTFKTNIILSIIGIGLSIAGAIIVLITLRKRKINEI